MNAVGSSHFKGVLELNGSFGQYSYKLLDIGNKDYPGIAHLHGKRGITNIR